MPTPWTVTTNVAVNEDGQNNGSNEIVAVDVPFDATEDMSSEDALFAVLTPFIPKYAF